MSKQPTEAALSWKQRINQWQESGKSLAQWSRENNFTYSQSLYWKMKFLGSQNRQPCSKGFIELHDERIPDSGVVVEAENVRIHLASDFDAPTLLRCLSLLKEKTC